ncbi:hypothetical protein DPMN_115740 [Dreissena polymorpha]|uniref:FAS1 domain-containing protein n=1 Tax=Dreissena polymorpha TaxID=45954 RepID=A0A9D4KLT7_DREPO|nr:hypothetical protein DPMN_115740 [Dreissena polymorpha]
MLQYFALLLVVSACGCRALSTLQILEHPRFTTLVSLLTKAGLVDTLNQGTYTIFAPSDVAFAALPASVLQALETNATLLKNVLLYHVVAKRVLQTQLTNDHKETSEQGKPIRFNVYSHNHITTAEGRWISAFDKVADNGVIHSLGMVMMPPEGDIVNIVAGHNETSTLLSLVVAAGIAGALHGTNRVLIHGTV